MQKRTSFLIPTSVWYWLYSISYAAIYLIGEFIYEPQYNKICEIAYYNQLSKGQYLLYQSLSVALASVIICAMLWLIASFYSFKKSHAIASLEIANVLMLMSLIAVILFSFAVAQSGIYKAFNVKYYMVSGVNYVLTPYFNWYEYLSGSAFVVLMFTNIWAFSEKNPSLRSRGVMSFMALVLANMLGYLNPSSIKVLICTLLVVLSAALCGSWINVYEESEIGKSDA